MKKILIPICLLITGLSATARQADSTLTYITGEGLTIRLGKADANRFTLVSAVQPGIQYSRLDSAGKHTNANRLSLNLVRVALNASLMREKITASIVTDFTGVSPILEGWVGISMMKKKAKLIIGQKQTHTNNRLAMADERYAQVMGQSLAGKSTDGTTYGGLMQNFVGATREGGIFFESGFNAGSWKIYPSVSITTGEGQNFFDPQPNSGFKYGGRLDIMPLGDFIRNNAFIAHDIYREPRLKLAVGVAASYNVKASSAIGSENNTISGIYGKNGSADYPNYRKIVADFILKSRGFSLIGEYVNASIYGKDLYTNAAATSQFTTQMASVYYNLGSAYNFQTAYVCKSGWAFDARVAFIKPEFKTATSHVQEENWYTTGINKYMKNNALRAGLNVNYIERKAITNPADKLIVNLALQIVI